MAADPVVPVRSAAQATSDIPMPTPAASSRASPAPTAVRNGTVRLSVPLDSVPEEAMATRQTYHQSAGRRTAMRRDSLERREALLKGKEGSRQRRRWENDRLLSNPWAVAPTARDYEIRPTHQVRLNFPYYLAPLWDAAEFQRSVEAKLHPKSVTPKQNTRKHRMTVAEANASNVPKEVRAKLKRARAAKGLLKDLEEQVRLFLVKWDEKVRMREADGLGDVPFKRPHTPTRGYHVVQKPNAMADSAVMSDSESDADSDDELVFVGRNIHVGSNAEDAMVTTLDSPGRKRREEAFGLDDAALGSGNGDKMVFEGLEADKGAGFARWLVHSIGAYYGLKTWSVTVRPPTGAAMRGAWVGVDGWSCARAGVGSSEARERPVELPRPLWGMV